MTSTAQEHETIAVRHGTTSRSMAELLSALLASDPQIVWCEPRPHPVRLSDFPGLWRSGDFASLAKHLNNGVPLDEARLYFPDMALHLLHSEGQTRVALFHLGSTDERDATCGQLLAILEDCLGEWTYPAALQQTTALRSNVITRRDLRRYGLSQLADRLPPAMRVVRYLKGTQLVFWKLEI